MFRKIRNWWISRKEIVKLEKAGRKSASETFGALKFGEVKCTKSLENEMLCPLTIEDALNDYRMMITNWYVAYLKLATGEENDKCLWEDFWTDIETYLMPKIARHYQCKHIDNKALMDFHGWLVATYQSLVSEIKCAKTMIGCDHRSKK